MTYRRAPREGLAGHHAEGYGAPETDENEMLDGRVGYAEPRDPSGRQQECGQHPGRQAGRDLGPEDAAQAGRVDRRGEWDRGAEARRDHEGRLPHSRCEVEHTRATTLQWRSARD